MSSIFVVATAISYAAADTKYCYPDGIFGATNLGRVSAEKFCNASSNAPDGNAYILAGQTIYGCAEIDGSKWDMSITSSCDKMTAISQANCVARMKDIESCGSAASHRGGTWQNGCLKYYLDPNAGKCTL
ncbi:hypothetical protein BOTBODRAFT_478096 [Botryobasidium botryosum FD-172 SS1]|uniref:Cyanovirin-N domain-containing protein n=1 Tax=Botryobasidium botryosum (strain FD-172 SS1) TaxID=930990 RepID=A0A067MTH4_BOTB1|nr:hypothetical protein BOTBODRAFT_478096 [Botryobasidium botryosum FD-172 SS1]